MNVTKRSKNRTVVVQQSPVTLAERAEAARTKQELTEALADMKYALDGAMDDLADIELRASERIRVLESRVLNVGGICALLGCGLGATLSYLPW
jgi:hypothetical protein